MNDVLKVATLGGDGTGPEVVGEAVKVLKEVAKLENIKLELTDFDICGERYLKNGGIIITDDEVEQLRQFSSILLGAVGHVDVKPGILEKGLLLRLRFEFDQYINLRPVKLLPGVATPLRNKGPEDLDFVVVRENTEDMYAGIGGFLKKGTPDEVATQTAIYTRKGCERCVRWAFEYARRENERSDVRTRPLDADVRRSRRGISGRSKRIPSRRRVLHLYGRLPGKLRRYRYDEYVRRHHHRLGGYPSRRSRRRGGREPLPGRRRNEHVRADRRHRAEVHRFEPNQPDRVDQLRRDVAGTRRLPNRRRPYYEVGSTRYRNEDEEPSRRSNGVLDDRNRRPRLRKPLIFAG